MHRIRIVTLLTLSWAIFAGCSGKSVLEAPDVGAEGAELVGRTLRWTTTERVRASVRYGFAPGDYEIMAYPSAEDRGDRAYRTTHSVPLLGLRDGETIYYQLVQETEPGLRVVSSEASFVADVGPASGLLVSTMIHIGWGDCHVLQMPTTGDVLLIDAGDDDAPSAVAEVLAALGVDQIDTALATHVHFDHAGGFLGSAEDQGVLERFPIDRFLDSPDKRMSGFNVSTHEGILATLEAEEIERVVVARGDTDDEVAALALDPSVDIRVLHSGTAPDVPATGHSGTDANNDSIVLKISYGHVDMIIGGDAEFEAEASMLAAFAPSELDAEYYKAHHHGRNDGSSNGFLAAVRPRVALVPVSWAQYRGGRSDYESSTNPALGRIANAGAHAYVIDDLALLGIPWTNGARHNISFVTDGTSYEVRAEIAAQAVKHRPHSHSH